MRARKGERERVGLGELVYQDWGGEQGRAGSLFSWQGCRQSTGGATAVEGDDGLLCLDSWKGHEWVRAMTIL